MPASVKAAAKRYIEMGYAVFPLLPGQKAPATEHGVKDATRDPSAVADWNPNANIGIATDGLVVLDEDPGAPAAFFEQHKADLEKAPLATTPRQGKHWWFRDPTGRARNTASRFAVHVDTRASGGYAAAWPSRVGSGGYTWVRPLVPLADLPEAPAWLLSPPRKKKRKKAHKPSNGTRPAEPRDGAAAEAVQVWGEGCRNAGLTSYAGSLRSVGATEQELAAALATANRTRCRPPLPLDEVRRIAASVARYDRGGELEDDEDLAEDIAEGDPGPVPEHLLSAPGFINDLTEYTLRTSYAPNRVLAFSGSIATYSVVVARRLRGPRASSPTMYVSGIANSAAGKERPRQVAGELFAKVAGASILHDIASGEGLEDFLYDGDPSALLVLDEFDSLLSALGDRKDHRYKRLASKIMTLYSAAGKEHTLRVLAGRERRTVRAPALVLYASAIPSHFYRAVTPKIATNGMLARMLVFDAGRRGEDQEPMPPGLPAHLVRTAKLWLGEGDDVRPDRPPRVVCAREDRAVVKARARWRKHFMSLYREAEKSSDDPGMALWGRALEKASKLALLYAASLDTNATGPTASVEAVDSAGELVEHLTRRMLWRLATTPEDTPQMRIQDKILGLLRGAPKNEMSGRLMLRNIRNIREADRDEALKTLCEAGLVHQKTAVRKRGRPSPVWKLRR